MKKVSKREKKKSSGKRNAGKNETKSQGYENLWKSVEEKHMKVKEKSCRRERTKKEIKSGRKKMLKTVPWRRKNLKGKKSLEGEKYRKK